MTATPQEIVKEVLDGLRVTLTVGAARADIGDDREKVQRIQEELVVPMGLYQITGNPEFLLETIQEVMGEGWKPSPQWAEYLAAVDRLAGELPGK